MKSEKILIRTMSNLHVGGSGDADLTAFNEVQKDYLTGLPIIHGSSLKGALRKNWSDSSTENTYFGARHNSGEEQLASGSIIFTDSELIFYPVRLSQSNGKSYILATTHEILEKFGITVEGEEKWNLPQNTIEGCFSPIEEKIYIYQDTKYVVLSDCDFKKIVKNLPLIARNHLEVTGKSKNLWYEEIVPRESIFITNLYSDNDDVEKFVEVLERQEHIQIGANTSVGYGICKFKKVGKENAE